MNVSVDAPWQRMLLGARDVPDLQAADVTVVHHAVAIACMEAGLHVMCEKPVAPVPGTGSPRYPDILRSASVEGEVLAQFVVDTTGRVEVATFKVIRKSHDLFEAAVRSALPNMRFLPAEVGGRKVKQLVQQPFVFALQK